MLDFLPFMGLALLLGIKHSYDADHMIAVGNLLRKAESIKSAINMTLSWTIGHMLTASILTIILYIYRESILKVFLANFDILVGGMLILLGFLSVKDAFTIHKHEHEDTYAKHMHTHLHSKVQENDHTHMHVFGLGIHKQMIGIGIIHGLASNDELLLLLTASLGVATLFGIISGIAVFSLGVALGMMIFAIVFSSPMLKIHNDKIYRGISFVLGVGSIVYGLLMVFLLV